MRVITLLCVFLSACAHRITLTQSSVCTGLRKHQAQLYHSTALRPFRSAWLAPITVNDERVRAILDTGSSDIVVYTDEHVDSSNRVSLAYRSRTISVQPDTAMVRMGPFIMNASIGWVQGNQSSILGLADASISRLSGSFQSVLPYFVLSLSPRYSWFSTRLRKKDVEQLFYVPISDRIWKTNVARVLFDYQPLTMETTWLHVDSGTAIIRGPYKHVISLLSTFTQYKVADDCSDVRHLPVISFEINGIRFDLEPVFYMVHMDGNCLPAFGSSGSDDWVVGEPFLYKYLTVFDSLRQRMGFGLTRYAINECALPPVPIHPWLTHHNDAVHVLDKMDQTLSLQAISNKDKKTSSGGAASSAGGASNTVTSVVLSSATPTTPRATSAPTKAPTKGKYASD